MLHVGAVVLDVLAQTLCNLAVALEQILTGHTGLAGSATARDDIFSTGECFLSIGGGSDVHVIETALAHFLGHALGREYVIQADVGSQAHREGGLNHVGSDHAGSTDDDQFVVC